MDNTRHDEPRLSNVDIDLSNLLTTNPHLTQVNNASIVALRPFDQEELKRLSRQKNYTNLPNIKSAGRNKSGKAVINKAMRFYEPIRDAEMLSQLERLRTKLVILKPQDIHQSFANSAQSAKPMKSAQNEKSEHHASNHHHNNANSENMFFYPRKFDSIIQQHEFAESNNYQNKIDELLHNSESASNFEKTHRDEMKSSTINNAVLDIQLEDLGITEEHSPRIEKIFDNHKSNEQHSSKFFTPSFERRHTLHETVRHHTVPNNSSRIHCEPLHRAATTINQSQTNVIVSNHETIKIERKSIVPLMPTFGMKQAKVRNLVRRSTKTRLGNIYKTPEHPNGLPATHQTTIINDEQYRSNICVSETTTKESKTAFNTGLKRPKTTANLNKSLSIVNPEQSRKLHPSVKYLKSKIFEPPFVDNIINDIPSTIKIMSKKGKVTNVEKLIAFKLSDYYTNYRVVF